MAAEKNILVCPLDWGLGHATRMVPVIKELEKQGAKVVLAADNRPLDFLMRYFPTNKVVKLEGFNPVYPEKGSMAWTMIKSVPGMIRSSRLARTTLNRLIKELSIDAIISDNRYELFGTGIPTIFITHQLNIQTKGIQILAKPIINMIINGFLRKFDEIWVPDDSNHTFSGLLSETNKYRDKIHFVGVLSRFQQGKLESNEGFEILAIMSGPEPQRSLFERLVVKQLAAINKPSAILQGKPGTGSIEEIGGVTLIPHANDDDFANLVNSAKIIISRPGYSTIMDLAQFGKSGIFVPTPGQTEQEYLAKKLNSENRAVVAFQNKLDIAQSIELIKLQKGISHEPDSSVLTQRISHLLNNC